MRVAAQILLVHEQHHRVGPEGDPTARLVTDLETFGRFAGGRRPDPMHDQLDGCSAEKLRLVS
jgi:hypothetical protein